MYLAKVYINFRLQLYIKTYNLSSNEKLYESIVAQRSNNFFQIGELF
jgi:hypothetical protein